MVKPGFTALVLLPRMDGMCVTAEWYRTPVTVSEDVVEHPFLMQDVSLLNVLVYYAIFLVLNSSVC